MGEDLSSDPELLCSGRLIIFLRSCVYQSCFFLAFCILRDRISCDSHHQPAIRSSLAGFME